ncbi:MAG: ATP phosphoribosyltransferase regulatory subunit [Acidobacteriota bacterium]|nr:ATP phosphoribosyltransferase regulatory subunit [Acidobacteriota bacterium]
MTQSQAAGFALVGQAFVPVQHRNMDQMTEPLSRIPTGMRYYFGQEARLRRTVEETAMTIFDGWSYEEITTPTIDYYSLFEHGMGKTEAHRAFRFTDTDGRLLALRPDVTSAAARAAATLFAERERPLRLCYAAPVFRQQPQSHAEWRRESTQIGCELIGANTRVADLEVLAIASEFLRRLDLEGNYVITLNDVGIFNGVAERLKLDPTSREEMRQLIDVRNAADLERFLTPHSSATEAQAFAQLMQLSGKRESLDLARSVISNEQSRAALDRLESLWNVIESSDLTHCFEIDLGDVARLDYYTGLTFKIYVKGAGYRVGSGGRYDGLTASFGKEEPAVGFVLDLDALTDVVRLRPADSSSTGTPTEGSPELRANDPDEKGPRNPRDSGDSSSDPSELFLEALKRRAKGERVSLKLR